MRRSLLNKLILSKSLRQALVLFTLLILPSSAWGQGTIEIAGFDATNAEVMQNNYGSTVSFNSETNTLTLNNATILGAISTSIDGLVIELIGKNTITASDGPAILSTVISNNIVLSFKSTESTVGSLTAIPKGDKAIKGFEISYGNGLSLIPEEMVEGETVVVGKDYGLKLGNIYVSNANADNIFNATNPSNNQPTASYSNGVLTLNGVTLGTIDESNLQNSDFVSIVSELDALTINLIGENKLYGTITSNLNNATLAFTGDGSLEISGESSTITDFTNVDFGDFNLASKSAPGIYWNKEDKKLRGFEGPARDVTITKASYYPIWVHGSTDIYATHTQLTEADTPISIGGGTISFDGEHTITVSTVNFNIESTTMIIVGPDMPELTINLIGANSVRIGSSFLALWNTTPLTFTFTTNENSPDPGNVTAPTIVSWMSDNSQSLGGQITYENGLVFNYDSSSTYTETISTTGARIKIGGAGSETVISRSTDENGLFDGTVFFDASNNTLTLKGATLGNIDSYGIKVFVDNLTVKIDEGNSIYGVIQYEGINKSSLIQIEKADKATSASLTLSNIQGFRSCTWSDDLYLSADNGDDVVDVYYDPDAKVNSIPIGMMVSYYGGTIANITFSTEEFNAIWVAGNIVTGTGNVEGVGISSDLGTVYYDSSSHTLTLNGASIYTNESNPSPLIICNGDLTVNLVNENHINFSGNYSTYVFKNNSSTGQITFNSGGEGASLSITSSFYEGTYKGLCDGFSTVNFNNDLGLFNYSGSKAIKNVTGHAPGFYLDNGVCYWSTEGLLLNATYYYKIDYVDTSKEGSGVEVDLETDETNWGFGGANFNSSDLLGPCTITTYSKVNGTIIGSNKAKLFAIADNTITLNSTTLNSELTIDIQPAIEEGDGVSLTITNSFNPVVIQVEEGTATIVGIGECNLDASLAVLSSSSLTVLNTREGDVVRLSTKVTVLPDKPSIEKDTEHDYLETDKITITRTSVDGEDANDLKIFYTWDKDIVVETYQQYTEGYPVSIYDPNEKIPAQTGTLRAWVGYHAGDNCFYNSEVVSEEFTVYEIAEMEWESESQTYGTYYNPDKDMAVPSGSTAYIVTGISEDGTKVTISPVSYIKAGVAVLIERDKTTEVSKTTDFSASKMEYSNPDTPAKPSSTDNWYVIYNNKFVKVTEGTQVKGGKCYLNLSSSVANTRGFYNIGDGEGTTAIREVRSEGVNSEKLADGAWHDLQGRKFTTKPTKPGLYILNGKKIVIK